MGTGRCEKQGLRTSWPSGSGVWRGASSCGRTSHTTSVGGDSLRSSGELT